MGPRALRPSRVVVGTVLVATLTTAGIAHAQIEPLEGGDGPVSRATATILPIEATIVALDAGTSTTSSIEEVAITLEADVFFAFDEAELSAEGEGLLEDVADRIADAGVTALSIGGHTDSIGTDAYNQDLSERRARTVAEFLAARLDGVRFTTEGFGAREPVAPNETEDGEDHPEGRARNRRVELRYTP